MRLSSAPASRLERLDAGLDEAGFGPLLGPLCFGWSAVRVPADAPDLWTLFRAAVARAPARSPAALPSVCDSKALHAGNEGFARLERTALLFLGLARGRPPASIRELVEGEDPGRFALHPWYRNLEVPLPRRVPPALLEEDAARLRRSCAAEGASIEEAGVRVVTEAAFNEGIRRTGNKATVHFETAAAILRRLALLPRSGEASIVADRFGGRRFYGAALASQLPEFFPTPLREARTRSEYRLHGEAAPTRLAFVVRGERASFPCALGSILAKYARELLVERMNDHFRRRAPDLVPTAGYVQDGRRFVADLRRKLPPEEVPLDLLVRLR